MQFNVSLKYFLELFFSGSLLFFCTKLTFLIIDFNISIFFIKTFLVCWWCHITKLFLKNVFFVLKKSHLTWLRRPKNAETHFQIKVLDPTRILIQRHFSSLATTQYQQLHICPHDIVYHKGFMRQLINLWICMYVQIWKL